MKKILPLLLLTPISASAECTPAPDCADMGYTETSCSGSFVRCPFDTSKLFCTPCDSSFQYDCIGDNIAGGVGNTCAGKYASCECSSSEYSFSKGNCICVEKSITDCIVGAIYYADGTCSNDYVSCQNPVGVVVKDNELITLLSPPEMQWSADAINIAGLSDITANNLAMADYSGFSNTATIVAHYGANASDNASVYCYNYAPVGLENSKGKWYLPALGEVWSYLYPNTNTIKSIWSKVGTYFANHYIISSTEASTTEAWNVGIHSGSVGFYYKHHSTLYSVACFLSIK